MKHKYSFRKKSTSQESKARRKARTHGCVVVEQKFYEALRQGCPAGWTLLLHGENDGTNWLDWPVDGAAA